MMSIRVNFISLNLSGVPLNGLLQVHSKNINLKLISGGTLKINFSRFIQFIILLSLLTIPNSAFAQKDKAQNMNANIMEIKEEVLPASALSVYINEDFSSSSGNTPPQGWTQNIISGEPGVDLWNFEVPSGTPVNFPMSLPVAIFESYNSFNNQAEDVALESPAFSIDGGAGAILEFDHYYNHRTTSEIFVEVWNGNSWVTVFSSTSTSQNPEHVLVDITSEASGVANSKVRFRWTGNSSQFWIIDNIMVYSAEPPPVPASPLSPSDGAVDVDINSHLLWESGIGPVPTGYRLYFGTDGGGVAPPANIVNNLDMQLAAEYIPDAPLIYNTLYYWMIVPYNETGDASGVPIWSFTVTEDPPVSTYPYSENFEGSFPPLYYIRYIGLLSDPVTVSATNAGWEQSDWRNILTPVNKAAKLNISGTSLNHWLMTTFADFENDTDYQLEFDLTLNAAGTSGPPETGGIDDRFAVVISTDSGSTWLESNILEEWNNSGSPDVYDDISSLGEHVVINLSGYSGMIQLGFYGESSVANADNDLMIDNLEIKKILMPPVISINPSELDFGSIGVGTTRTLRLEVSNTGDEDLVISNIVSADEEYTLSPEIFPVTITSGNIQAFDVTFSPVAVGVINSSLEITNNTAVSPVSFNLQGSGSDDGPAFNASPVSLNFGLTTVNTTKSLNVIVSNTGLINELQISSALIADSGYLVTPLSANIPAGENQVFTVSFSPGSAETYSGSLVFTSNDPASPHTIPLTGKGAGKSGLLFSQDTVYQLEDDIYTSVIQLKGLDPLGERVQAIQFRLTINKSFDDNTILTFRNIRKGLDVSDENWVLDYNLFRGPITANGASVDSVYVLLYNLQEDGGLDPEADYNDLFNIEYRISNLPALNDTLKSSLAISNASATTGNGYPVDISSPENTMVVMAINRVSSRGDVNGDGYIDILDLIMVVDHIIGKDSLAGDYFKRADISPWIPGVQEPEPDGIVNVQDLSLIQNIILTGFYPDDSPIRKSISGLFAKITGNPDAEIKAYITSEGITLYVDSKFEIRGAQIEFENINTSAGNLNINTDLGQGYFQMADSSFRTLLYDRLAAESIEPGKHLLADMQFKISDPLNVVPGRILLVDADRHRLNNVDIEIINENAPSLPHSYMLYQNYPNPFNPSTSIKFQVPVSCYVTLKVYNMLGEEIRTLFSGQVMRGTHTINWDGISGTGGRLSSGTYLYRLTARGEGQEEFLRVRKMLLLK